ncbi:protein THEM6-like [Protobothrops mucrosquamatus]|uniref:protein THEM6-like n=1 Tax=Protobothrops mucrosquamatus TaxID=103944 RepID=UPI000775F185|nr:protein THEM6-like [Protobothrops mucrosquamatus]
MLVLTFFLFSAFCLGVAISFTFLDAWYLLYFIIMYLRYRLGAPKIKVLEEGLRYSWVLPSDLDLMGHMNNSRYAREADFARYLYMFQCRLLQTIWNCKYTTVLVASSWRFRRSLKLGERFAIRTRMLGWDDHSFYLEQQFISCQDGFVCAVLLARHHVTGVPPSKVLQILYGRQVDSPEIPEDVHYWLKSNRINSERVKKELQQNNKSK